jgi:uncharacterized membrane protein HdeD (DUF308 family)
MAQTYDDFHAAHETGQRAGWGWYVALGAALLVLSAFAFGNLLAATVASVYFVGILMLAGAVLQIVHAFEVKRWGGFFLWLLSGLLYGAAGVLAFWNPLLAASALTLLLAVALIVSGIFRIAWSLALRRLRGWGWLLASGLVTVLAGVVFLVGWPQNSLWLLGIVLAVDLAFQGAADLVFGFGQRRHSGPLAGRPVERGAVPPR